jgi:hypothetical protein
MLLALGTVSGMAVALWGECGSSSASCTLAELHMSATDSPKSDIDAAQPPYEVCAYADETTLKILIAIARNVTEYVCIASRAWMYTMK